MTLAGPETSVTAMQRSLAVGVVFALTEMFVLTRISKGSLL